MVDRKKQLSQVFNNVFKEVVKEDKDFYSHLGISDFVKLKKLNTLEFEKNSLKLSYFIIDYLH